MMGHTSRFRPRTVPKACSSGDSAREGDQQRSTETSPTRARQSEQRLRANEQSESPRASKATTAAARLPEETTGPHGGGSQVIKREIGVPSASAITGASVEHTSMRLAAGAGRGRPT